MSPSPRITSIVIVPARGHSAATGDYDRGHVAGNVSELDVIDMIVAPLTELLDEYYQRFTVMPTRAKPGVAEDRRHEMIPDQALVLEIALDWFSRPRLRNYSQVYYGSGGHAAKILSELMCDTLSEWGAISCFGHRCSNPKESTAALLNCPNTVGIRIEPMALNGPDVVEYLKRIRALGQDLANCLIDFTAAGHSCSSKSVITCAK